MESDKLRADKLSAEASEKIAMRNNWLTIAVVSVVTVVVAFKFWQTDFSQLFSTFNFSDLLTLCLALFSILLSVQFYFKATETSNVFYDNTYRFTKDVSEILGRVEAGFGEKLEHLDKGYSGIKTAVEQLPFDRTQTEKKIEEEEGEVTRLKKEKEKLIEELAKKAQLDDEQKLSLFAELEEKDDELSSARQEIRILEAKMHQADAHAYDYSVVEGIPEEVMSIVRRFILNKFPHEVINAPPPMLRDHVTLALKGVPRVALAELKKHGVLNAEGDITQSGISMIHQILSGTTYVHHF